MDLAQRLQQQEWQEEHSLPPAAAKLLLLVSFQERALTSPRKEATLLVSWVPTRNVTYHDSRIIGSHVITLPIPGLLTTNENSKTHHHHHDATTSLQKCFADYKKHVPPSMPKQNFFLGSIHILLFLGTTNINNSRNTQTQRIYFTKKPNKIHTHTQWKNNSNTSW